uniref:Sorting nexin-33-like n=1 Tax=Phallusia mammillata TaxID=59560 RepID=A0A6F9DSP0_9ASCI|nr:sorting nexin-33-like [Phallusia mammillata]
MTEQASVLYTFEGLPENGEISLVEGETIKILNKNIGEGWWEGQASDGRVGLFPEAYVQLIVVPVPEDNALNTPRYADVPTESYEQQTGYQPATDGYSPTHNNGSFPSNYNNTQNNYNDDDAWSEDWDDSSTVATTVVPMHAGAARQYGNEAQDVSSINSVESRSSKVSGSVSKNFNRFSSFVKHGGESYMLGKADARVRQVDQVQIVMDSEGPKWRNNEHQFSCKIGNPKEQSKMKGLKKFVCYNLTPSDTEVTVQRRYKHFDWLYGRLVERYPMVAVPRLPDKQASGRFEEDFIEARMARLKLWVGYICRHPVLSKSQLFRNFLTLTEQKAWKMSKRQAEKDDLSSANFFLTVSLPPTVTTVTDADGPLDQFKKFTKAMDDGVSQFATCSQSLANKHVGIFKREYQSFGKAITTIAAGFNMHQTTDNKTLTNALKAAGSSYNRVGEMFANQPKEDLHQVIDSMWLYKGLLETLPDVWHIQTGAMRKVRECKKLKEEGKMTDVELGAVTERADRVVCCMRAEMSHFHTERIRDFAISQRDLLRNQADFFERVAGELRTALGSFDELNLDS